MVALGSSYQGALLCFNDQRVRKAPQFVSRVHPPVPFTTSRPIFCFFCTKIPKSDKISNFFPEIGQGFLLFFWGLCTLINLFLVHNSNQNYFFWNLTTNYVQFQISGRWDVRSHKKGKTQSEKTPKKTPVWALVRLLWRLPRARNECSSCPGIFSRTLRFYYVASSPGSPLPHLLDGHRKLVGSSAIPARSFRPVCYPLSHCF